MRFKNYSVDNSGLIMNLYETETYSDCSNETIDDFLEIIELEAKDIEYIDEISSVREKEGFIDFIQSIWLKAIIIVLGLIFLCSYNFGKPKQNNINYISDDLNHINELLCEISVAEETKEKFIKRFSSVAKDEMHKFSIPASIILGLAIINSNYGTDVVAQNRNNYFLSTCSDNQLEEGVLGTFEHQGNCYIHFQNPWTSFRSNSLKLSTSPYFGLKLNAGINYKIWLEELEGIDYPHVKELGLLIEKRRLYNLDE
ncbi:MAG: glucosaminidase domain-containing protein [Saprospiraceae bacterium]|nr:glucosaminidase domain-containing protein [Saprospiraceae bacterium]